MANRRSVWIVIALLVASLAAWRGYAQYRDQTQRTAALVESFVASIATAEQSAKQLRVVIFDDKEGHAERIGNLTSILGSAVKFNCGPITADEILSGGLSDADIIVFPGGSGRQQAKLLGSRGKKIVRDFIEGGGGYVGICAGAYLGTCVSETGLAVADARYLTGKVMVEGEGMRSISARGKGTVEIQMTNAGQTVLGYEQLPIQVTYGGGPVLSPGRSPEIDDYVVLARYSTEVWSFKAQKGTMVDTPAIVASNFGNGRVILVSPHLEMTPGLEAMVKRIMFAAAPLSSEEERKSIANNDKARKD